MQIQRITINSWRNFENVELEVDKNSKLICLVGDNGTGKSHILELIAACAHRLGLTPGIDIPRGNPFSDEHNISLEIYFPDQSKFTERNDLMSNLGINQWDGALKINCNNSKIEILAGNGSGEFTEEPIVETWIDEVRNSEEVFFLFLDSNRAYPKQPVNSGDIGNALRTDWSNTQYKKSNSYKPTEHLYSEWLKYMLALESQAGIRHNNAIRKARESGQIDPNFKDHFDNYKKSILEVLPHLSFLGVEPTNNSLLFNTSGLDLSFDQISGGEKEIAFLLGQIDRFSLREGLFLLDEPELHLNPNLIRSWITYLTTTIETGQVWIATHSLEAVEAAGTEATFVLERDSISRKVNNINRLDTKPVYSTLSRAVGSPAFSISNQLFVFVEGEGDLGERELFQKLADTTQEVKFIACGSCNEVIRRVEIIENLAEEANSDIRVVGVVDRDFRSSEEIAQIEKDYKVHVLHVHEVENFFLNPNTLKQLLDQNGNENADVGQIIQQASDERAGSWIYQHFVSSQQNNQFTVTNKAIKALTKQMKWSDISSGYNQTANDILKDSNLSEVELRECESLLVESMKQYEQVRNGTDLWKDCEGKQAINSIFRQIGFSQPSNLKSATFKAWKSDENLVFQELIDFRIFLNQHSQN